MGKLCKIGTLLATVCLWLFLVFSLSNITRTQKILGVARVETPEKVVALTYDDGPAPIYTRQILDVLDRHRVKATFFAVGKRIQSYPEGVCQIVAHGHELGNHSHSHRDMLFKHTYFLWTEVDHTDRLLRSLGAMGPLHFRPPRGKGFLGAYALLSGMGKQLIMWDVDPADYQRGRSPEDITRRVLRQVRPGSIVLLHDGGGDRSRTAAATDLLIPALQSQGYRFLTVSELLKLREQQGSRAWAVGSRQ